MISFKNIKVKIRLMEMGKTQYDMSEALEVRYHKLNHWLNGSTNMPEQVKTDIATYLDSDVDILFKKETN